jgi:hypothetical protein
VSYELEGRLLEACTCDALCPCWVGRDPDYGTCEGLLCWHFDRGTINGIDVAGRTFAILTHIPGNILQGNWKVVVFIDDGATDEQHQALIDVWTGKFGGPIADLARLVGEVLDVRRVPVTFDFERGKGVVRIGEAVEAVMEPFVGATGEPTAMHDTVFTTIPGSPAYMGTASIYRVAVPEHDFDFELHDHNSVQGSFRFEAA